MQKPLRLAVLIPASVLLAAGGPCGGDTDNPVVERCATSHTIVVERGAKSAAIPNLCATTVNTTEWDRTRWDVTFDIPPPLLPTAEWPAPERPVYAVDAPMESTVGDVVGSLKVQLKGSKCTNPLGAIADCVANIALTIRVVEPGTVPPLTVRIAATRPGGSPVADDGRVPVDERVALSAVAEGEGASGATFTWRALNLVGGAVDPEVDGKSGRDVLTSAFQERERVYEVVASAGGLTAQSTLVLAGVFVDEWGRSYPLTGPLRPIPSYPGSAWVIRYEGGLGGGYDVNGNAVPGAATSSAGYARLDYLPESASWSREEQDEFLRNPMGQAQVVWSTVGPNPQRHLACPNDENGQLAATSQDACHRRYTQKPTYFMPAEAQGLLGVFRAVFWGSRGAPTAFSYTFVRRY